MYTSILNLCVLFQIEPVPFVIIYTVVDLNLVLNLVNVYLTFA